MEATSMFINREMDEEDVYIYMMEYYSAIKKNEIMLHAATGIDQESVIMSEVNQTRQRRRNMTSLIHGI